MKGGQLVREARRRAGLSQAELARRVGTSQAAVARWEANAVSPTVETLTRVLEACGFDLGVHLVPHDDHDLSLAVGNLRFTPQERLDNLVALVDFVSEGRRAAERAGAEAGG